MVFHQVGHDLLGSFHHHRRHPPGWPAAELHQRPHGGPGAQVLGLEALRYSEQGALVEDQCPSGYVKIAIENDPVEIVDFPINSMVIFNSYVKLPEGNLKPYHHGYFLGPIACLKLIIPWFFLPMVQDNPHSWEIFLLLEEVW